MFTTVGNMIITRIFHGIGFGLTTTFSAAIAADIIPASRRGEGIGYFGLGSTVAMALAPAAGVWLVNSYGYSMMFAVAAAVTVLALFGTRMSHVPVIPVTRMPKGSLVDKLFERGTGTPALLTMLFGLSYGSVNTFVAMLAKEAHIADAGYFFILGTICVFLSRPIGGRVFDRKGSAWIILPGAVLFLAALLILINTTSLVMLLAASVLYGFGGGFLLPALITWMLNLVKTERRSAASATFYNMLDVGTSAGAIILGAIAERIGFIKMYLFSAAAMAVFLGVFIAHLILQARLVDQKQEEAA
jgi:MFS family permease